MDFARNIADRLISLSAVIGSIGLLVEMCIILAEAIMRALGSPIYGSQDLITMTMVIVVFGGMAICDRKGGHISIDIFERYLPRTLNRYIDAFSALLGSLIFLVIAWTVYDSSKLSVMLNLSTNLLNLPKVWFQLVLSAFALLTALGMALRSIELAFGYRDVRKSEAPL